LISSRISGDARAGNRSRTTSVALQQIAQISDRQVDTKAKDLDQLGVCFGARDDFGIAGIEKARAGVAGKLPNDTAFTTIDDYVGDGFRKVCPARNGQEMVWSFGSCNLHEVTGPRAAGAGRQASGHCDFVVPCGALDNFERSAVDWCQTRSKFSSGTALNASDKKAQNAVEDLDLLLV
jgi:hypothetical protein